VLDDVSVVDDMLKVDEEPESVDVLVVDDESLDLSVDEVLAGSDSTEELLAIDNVVVVVHTLLVVDNESTEVAVVDNELVDPGSMEDVLAVVHVLPGASLSLDVREDVDKLLTIELVGVTVVLMLVVIDELAGSGHAIS
jgi:hypothetical protein